MLVWQVSFSFMGIVRNIWLLAECEQKIIWKLNLAGALLSALINLLLIRQMGALGAAVASLVTQIFTNFVLGYIVPELRSNNRLIIKGMNPKLIRNFLHRA